MSIVNIYNRIALLSPYFEVALRYAYWKNIKYLKRYRPAENISHILKNQSVVDFSKITNWLCKQGLKKGSLVICHSSYDSLKGTGLKPNEIIQKIREIIGDDGTLAMPVIRHYKDYPQPLEWLTTDFSKIICKYDPRRTPVTSGMLPSMLMREKNAEISMHPLNTMVAVGPLAKEMMEHNLDGEKPTPHGPGSSWKYCVDHDAIIISIGVQMIHHLTIAHVPEDNNDYWPIRDWYQDVQFDIVMPDKSTVRRTVRERKPKWGLIHDAELNFGHDLLKAGIMHTSNIDGIEVGFMHSKVLIDFMLTRKNKSYPYYRIF